MSSYDEGIAPVPGIGRRRREDELPLAPHRGQMIMTLGIISLFFGGLILGPIAWIMGKTDLAEMDAGRMDDSGRDNTNTGKICGMISTLLHGASLALGLFCCVGYVFFMGAMVTTAVGTSATAAQQAQVQQAKARREAQEAHEKARKDAEEAFEKARRDLDKDIRELDKNLPPVPPLVNPNPAADPPVEVAPVPNALAQPPAPPDVEAKTTVDLIALLDLKKDVAKGKWVVVDGVLHCNDSTFFSRVQFPYEPPEEYNFVVVFSQPNLRRSLGLMMPSPRGESASWELGGIFRRLALSTRPRRGVQARQPFQANTAYPAIIEMRRDSVRCLLDGNEVMKANPRELTADVFRKLTAPRQLGVVCDDPTVFHYVRVVEISGPGKKFR